MTRQELPEQHAFTYDDEEGDEGRIPRRSSATDEVLRERRRAAQGQGARTTSVPATRQRQVTDDEGEYDDVWPTRLPNSSRRYSALPTQRQRAYEITLRA